MKRTGFSRESRERSAAKAREKARTTPRKNLARAGKLQRKPSSSPKRRKAMKRSPVSPASPAQREKVSGAKCIACGEPAHDPAHVVSRALGGCDDPLCVVPLCRVCHDLYDGADLDLLPYLVKRHVAELQHALGHVGGSLLRLLHITTGLRYVPERKEAENG